MKLETLLIRFYKSFNFDYERKAAPSATPLPWEMTDQGWYPHVRVKLEEDITAIAGANESGKSHLLDAIEILLGHRDPDNRDFCRYSPLFSAELGQRRTPELGGFFSLVESESAQLEALGVPLYSDGRILLLRPTPELWSVVDHQETATALDADTIASLRNLMPIPVRLRTDVPVPDSIAIQTLAGDHSKALSRKTRREVLEALAQLGNQPALSGPAAVIQEAISQEGPVSAGDELGRQLLTDVANIDPSAFRDLSQAIEDENEGLVNGLIQTMNESISRHLTLSRWWTQDTDFTLRISPREHEVVFTIRDRTGTDYSFKERSLGLRYFLSYYIQLRSNQQLAGQPHILLLDEPDTYLSASGQQDLLRILEHHVNPDGIPTQGQIVYVTHSPFLVNRNAGHRIRVLDKGKGEEGTRVVRDASINRYEPLRSSLGAYVAETAFIGGTNLFVEGLSDQVLLAEMSAILHRRGKPASALLDLNQTTIVPCGSASSIPYMVYLARGQDEVKPPCVVLLDSDSAGNDTRSTLSRGGPRNKRLVHEEAVFMLADLLESHGEVLDMADGVVLREIEDLIPLQVAINAARSYAQVFLHQPTGNEPLQQAAVEAQIKENGGRLFDAVRTCFTSEYGSTIEKVGFAKEVIRYARTPKAGGRSPGVPALEENFACVISELVGRLRAAALREEDRLRTRRIERTIRAFKRDYPEGSTRDRANVMLREVEAASGETDHGDVLRQQIAGIRRTFKLATDPIRAIDDYEAFLVRVDALRYVDRLENLPRVAPSTGQRPSLDNQP